MKFFPRIIFVLFFWAAASGNAYAATLYTAHNIWFEPGKQRALWCINYKTGIMIPAGTEVRDARVVRTRGIGPFGQAITFVTVPDNRRYFVRFRTRFHPGKTIHDYFNTMFTPKTFETLTFGLSKEEIRAIRRGAIVLGMSKRAVIISYGYPPEHYTPSLRSNVWTYWMNRWRSKQFHFDEKGETVFPVSYGQRL